MEKVLSNCKNKAPTIEECGEDENDESNEESFPYNDWTEEQLDLLTQLGIEPDLDADTIRALLIRKRVEYRRMGAESQMIDSHHGYPGAGLYGLVDNMSDILDVGMGGTNGKDEYWTDYWDLMDGQILVLCYSLMEKWGKDNKFWFVLTIGQYHQPLLLDCIT
jgi:hypothetical protein